VGFLLFKVFINKLKIMERKIRLTERDLTRLIHRIISEQQVSSPNYKGDGGIQVSSPNYKGDGGEQVSAGMPQKFKTINPKIQIDCNRKLITYSQLPKLDKNANYAIINYYCNKQ